MINRTNPDFIREDKPFNMAIDFLMRLNRRWEYAQDAADAGDLPLFFRRLHSIYRQLYPKIKEAKDDDLDKKLNERFNKCREALNSYYKNKDPRIAGQLDNISISTLELQLYELDKEIGIAALKYKMIFPDLKNKKPDKNISDFIKKYVKPNEIKKALNDPDFEKTPVVDIEKIKKSYIDVKQEQQQENDEEINENAD